MENFTLAQQEITMKVKFGHVKTSQVSPRRRGVGLRIYDRYYGWLVVYFSNDHYVFRYSNTRQQELISSISEGQEQIQGLAVDRIQDAVEKQKNLILEWIVTFLENSGITGVGVIQDQGVIRLPENLI